MGRLTLILRQRVLDLVSRWQAHVLQAARLSPANATTGLTLAQGTMSEPWQHAHVYSTRRAQQQPSWHTSLQCARHAWYESRFLSLVSFVIFLIPALLPRRHPKFR